MSKGTTFQQFLKTFSDAAKIDGFDFRPRTSTKLTSRRIVKMLFAELFKQTEGKQEDELLNALLLWPPDLFAFTSTVLSVTGAYQLVASPPGVQGDRALSQAVRILQKNHPQSEHKEILESVKHFFSWPPQVDPIEYKEQMELRDLISYHHAPDDNLLAKMLKCAAKGQKLYPWKMKVRDLAFSWRHLMEMRFDTKAIGEFKHCKKTEEDKYTSSLSLSEQIELDKKNTARRIEQLEDELLNPQKGWVPAEVLALFNVLKEWFNTPEIENTNYSIDLFDLYSVSDINCFDSNDDEVYQHVLRNLDNVDADKKQELLDKAAFFHANFLSYNWVAMQALLTLHAIADEACIGLGTRSQIWEECWEKWKLECKKWQNKNSSNKESQKSAVKWSWEAVDNLKADASRGEPHNQVSKFAEYRLTSFGTLSNVHNQLCRILPKRHTPQLGITLRSLSSNISYHRSSTDVKWSFNNYANDHLSSISSDKSPVSNSLTEKLGKHKPNDPITLSVLLLPWPLKVDVQDFKPFEEQLPRYRQTPATPKSERSVMNNKDRMFNYEPKEEEKETLTGRLKTALDNAKKLVGEIDMVVLPECALSKSEVNTMEEVFRDNKYKVSMYIAGVHGKAEADEKKSKDAPFKGLDLPDNMVYFKMGSGEGSDEGFNYPSESRGKEPKKGKREPVIHKSENYYTQYKHHRWKLDGRQVKSYGLSHQLPHTQDWWEAIKIRRRRVTFVNVGKELTICPLICEDLARQDPMADLLRTVGPSLVVTVLMDGPQRKDRWSSRYATVLAEDPGCAVLTLTSAGMARLWKSSDGNRNVPPIIALWNDGHGEIKEIELAPNSAGVVLSLTLKSEYESTLDGRKAFHRTSHLLLGSSHQVSEEKTPQ